jgi:hypothetical protein
VSYISVRGGKHAMLGRHGMFDGVASDYVMLTLLDRPARGALERVANGEAWLEV